MLTLKSRLDSSLKGFLPIGLYAAVGLLAKELVLYRSHRTGTRKAGAYAGKIGLKLNIGCGSNRKEGWVNIDLSSNADLTLDMRERIPLSDNSAKIIYSEHFVEHLDYPENAKLFLRECFRLLEPNGIFRVGVPDASWPLLSYADVSDGGYFRACEAERWHPDWCKTRLDHINYHFRQGVDHRYAYDFETMEYVLKETGFVEIYESEFDPNFDTDSRKLGTLYLNALKPPMVATTSI